MYSRSTEAGREAVCAPAAVENCYFVTVTTQLHLAMHCLLKRPTRLKDGSQTAFKEFQYVHM